MSKESNRIEKRLEQLRKLINETEEELFFKQGHLDKMQTKVQELQKNVHFLKESLDELRLKREQVLKERTQLKTQKVENQERNTRE